MDLRKHLTLKAGAAALLSLLFAGTPAYAHEAGLPELPGAEPAIEAVQQDAVTITGTVVDNTDMPVIGANIVEKRTTNGTITDIDGNFSLRVAAGATLQISYTGYKTQEIAVGNQTHLNIKIEEDSELLGEVVVTALGLKREEKALGYAVQKVEGEALSTVKTVDIATSLTGKVAGMRTYRTVPSSTLLQLF